MTKSDPIIQTSRARRIAFILVEGFPLLPATAAIEPFRAANTFSGDLLYSLQFVSLWGDRATSSLGGSFDTKPFSQARQDMDIAFVVAGGNPLTFYHPELNGWLRRLDSRGVALGGISGGAAILARAGLMTNRRFTVHWELFDALRASDESLLMEQRLFVIDRNRYSCAGGIAPLDMAHAMIATEHGAELAQRVSDWFVHTHVRMAEDPQRAGLAQRYRTSHPALLAAIEYMQSHIADPLSLGQIASLSGIGERQMQRLFQTELNMPTIRFYRQLRLNKAQELLQRTSLPVTEVAALTGFASAAHFSRCFVEEFGHSPRRLRMRSGQSD